MARVAVNATVELEVWEKIRKKYPETDYSDSELVKAGLLKLLEEKDKK